MADLTLEIGYRTKSVPIFDEFDSGKHTDIVWKLYKDDSFYPYATGKHWYEKGSHKFCTDGAGVRIDDLLAILRTDLEVEIVDKRGD